MKIAYDAKRLYRNFTGLGNYSRTLVKNYHLLFPDEEIHLFTPKITKNSETDYFVNHEQIITHTPAPAKRLLWRTRGLVKDLIAHNIDIFHGLSHEIPMGLPGNIKSVVSMHDLIVMQYPEQFKMVDRVIYKQKYRYSCQNADHIIAISQSTKNDLMKYYKLEESRISVLYQTCGKQFRTAFDVKEDSLILKKHQLPEEYLLYVGSVIERKGLLDIVKALNKLSHSHDIPLVIIGSGSTYQKTVENYIEKQNLQNRIIWLDRVANHELPAIYRKATIFIYPSIYEGFGIPIIEAQYSKTPVITTKRSSLPEAAGDFAVYVEPNAPDEIAASVKLLLNDSSYREELTTGAFKHVQQFSPELLSRQLHQIYQQLTK